MPPGSAAGLHHHRLIEQRRVRDRRRLRRLGLQCYWEASVLPVVVVWVLGERLGRPCLRPHLVQVHVQVGHHLRGCTHRHLVVL
jgi:hypothetical protein